MRRSDLSAVAGPLSLLLLPKCPLCFASILTAVGVIVPGALGLRIAAGVIVAGWIGMLFLTTRGRNGLRVWALAAAAVSFIGVAMQLRPLLWAGVVAMTVAAIVAARVCAIRRA